MESCNRLKAAFAQNKQSMGMWQMLPGANVSRLLARSGVDWVMVDCEHGNIDGEFGMDCSNLLYTRSFVPKMKKPRHLCRVLGRMTNLDV